MLETKSGPVAFCRLGSCGNASARQGCVAFSPALARTDYVVSAASADGLTLRRFLSTHFTSKREVNMAPWIHWSNDDCKTARDEGWFIFCRKPYADYEIRRLARRNRFASDRAAVRFVRRRARARSPLHQIAVLIHDFFSDCQDSVDRARRKRPPKKIRCRPAANRPRWVAKFRAHAVGRSAETEEKRAVQRSRTR